MKNKEQLIEEHLAKPIEVGDEVVVRDMTKDRYLGCAIVVEVMDDRYRLNSKDFHGSPYGYVSNEYPKEWCTPYTNNIGANPFKKDIIRVTFINIDIESLLSKCAFNRRVYNDNFNYDTCTEKDGFVGTYGGMNFNPYVIGKDGTRHYYQRELVWTDDQKRMLIDSIYNGIEIGKFVVKYNSWESIVTQGKETGHGYSWDCVDGKQRMNAILDFVQNKFADSYGNYYNDLSADAKGKFLRYGNMSFGQLDENATSEEVLATFLTVNFTGAPMSAEHVEFVKSIKL